MVSGMNFLQFVLNFSLNSAVTRLTRNEQCQSAYLSAGELLNPLCYFNEFVSL